jgi:hypothetical protein
MSNPALFVTLGALAVYTYRRIFPSRQPQSLHDLSPEHPHIPVHRRPSPASNTDPSYYPRTPKDINAVIATLVTKLPAELVLDILDFAEYWVRETVERDERIVIAQPSAGTAYLRTWPILWASGGASSNSPPFPGTSLSFEDLAVEASSTSPPPTPTDTPQTTNRSRPGPVREITFTISSRDQGWSGQPQFHGTYEQSYTWFEARVIQPSESQPVGSEDGGHHNGPNRRHLTWTNELPLEQLLKYRPRMLQKNIHASRQATKHVVTWRSDAEDGEERRWVRSLQPGECVEVTVWAQYPGWSNHVESLRIDVLAKG